MNVLRPAVTIAVVGVAIAIATGTAGAATETTIEITGDPSIKKLVVVNEKLSRDAAVGACNERELELWPVPDGKLSDAVKQKGAELKDAVKATGRSAWIGDTGNPEHAYAINVDLQIKVKSATLEQAYICAG